MKKNKIILLTVLIMLVIYCGAVVFVTKPEGFDVSSLFTYSATMTEEDKAEIKDEVESEVKATLKAELKEELLSEIKAEVEAAVEKTVADSYATLEAKLNEAIKAGEATEVDTQALVAQFYETYKADLVAEIVEAVLAQLPEVEPEVKAEEPAEVAEPETTETVEPVVEEVEETPAESAETVETVETIETQEEASQEPVNEAEVEAAVEEILNNMTAEERASMSKEQYDALREQVREEQINDILSKLN